MYHHAKPVDGVNVISNILDTPLCLKNLSIKLCDMSVDHFAQVGDTDKLEKLYPEQVDGGANQEDDQCCHQCIDHH